MLVSPAWLAERLDEVVVLDASWHMPDAGRDAAAEFEAGHVPDARRFDIDAIADRSSALPHTLPSADDFAQKVGALGVSNDSTVVIYETGGTFAAPRAWWMFRVMGHDDANVLEGGLEAWRQAGLPLQTGRAVEVTPKSFQATFRRELFADARDVADALVKGWTILDARSPERFEGAAPEPREGVQPGHMPGAQNLHYAKLIDADGRLKDADALRKTFSEADVPLDKPVITTCGSGVTAAILALALHRLGTSSAVYDGSWTEWGSDPSRPRATGPAEPDQRS